MKKTLTSTAIALAAILPAQAHASEVITGAEALGEWNLIVLGDLTSSSEVEGRTFVGGDLNGNSSNYQIRTPAPSANGTPALTVVGDVTGGAKNINGGGATVGGNVTSGLNLNGPAQTVNVGGTIQNTNVNQNTVNSGLAATPGFVEGLVTQRDALVASLTDLSTSLSELASTAMASISGNRATFDAAPAADRTTVYALTAADLNTIGEIAFITNSADAVIVNVSGTDITLNDNFLGGGTGLGESVIWNFFEAETLTLSTAWYGSVLAPGATAQTFNFIEGSAVFANLQQDGEIHLNTFSGDLTAGAVPEPTTWAMMILGFGVVAGAMRSGRRQTRRISVAA